ncbi:MAG: transcription antitermination factor NusB [Gammaproteobacteria bacterium]|nr:transcription antitermination factor NusB [Gammaproteobacteria bacterium]MCK5262950.1 transcription antitermination factor NusB [Gammaproteobacteria bacterium]
MSQNTSLAKARGMARRFAMQAIYQWQMTNDDTKGIGEQYVEENRSATADFDYFRELFFGVEENLEVIDKTLAQYTGRAIVSVDPVERAILRLACYEFLKRLDVPYRVVLNEAVTLTKKFCSAQSHTFVNAVLDKVAHELRATEIS